MKPSKAELHSIKFRCYTEIGFGIIAAFILLGAISGKQLALVWGIIFIIGWGMTQAIRNALNAYQLLRTLKSTDELDTNEE